MFGNISTWLHFGISSYGELFGIIVFHKAEIEPVGFEKKPPLSSHPSYFHLQKSRCCTRRRGDPRKGSQGFQRYPGFPASDSHRPAPCMLPVGKCLFELTILSAAKVEVAAEIAY
jgi:hypothetical protein